MFDVYELSIIPNILRMFKVENIIINGLSDKNLIKEILQYDASFIAIDSNKNLELDSKIKFINDIPLNILPNLRDYDAIFINDDPNWHTVFNQLNLIKENNDEFPLVFICNNRFPHKRRDSYLNPDLIPDQFKHEYSKELPLQYNDENIIIKDNFYHAIDENTSKNGVLTAIEDFLDENPNIALRDIHLIEEITILYPKSTISTIRWDKIMNEINDKNIADIGVSDNLIENRMLLNYISENMSLGYLTDIKNLKDDIDKKDNIINDYKTKLRVYDNELEYKNSRISGVESQLNLKESQISNFEAILLNKNAEIDNLNNQINMLENDLNKSDDAEKSFEIQFDDKLNVIKGVFSNFEKQIDDLMEINTSTSNKLKDVERELSDEKAFVDYLKRKETYQFSKLDSREYCISCFKEELTNNNLEIQYLKNNNLTKILISPLSYLVLLFKSNPKELSLNIKLYNALKDSKCFDIGFYLKNNNDLLKSKWCKYLSPELHYVCYGFDENRKFNKKYFNRNSKKELLEYLLICEEL